MCVHLRNTSKSPVSILGSVHTCLAFGPGSGALLVSKTRVNPEKGDPLTLTYHGPNHMVFLDERAHKANPQLETLYDRDGTVKNVRLSAEDVAHVTTVLAPDGPVRISYVTYTPSRDDETDWQASDGSRMAPNGKFQVTTVLILDHKDSEWKGKLTSGSLEVELGLQDKHKK